MRGPALTEAAAGAALVPRSGLRGGAVRRGPAGATALRRAGGRATAREAERGGAVNRAAYVSSPPLLHLSSALSLSPPYKSKMSAIFTGRCRRRRVGRGRAAPPPRDGRLRGRAGTAAQGGGEGARLP